MSFKYNKLKGRIVEVFGTQALFSDKVGKPRLWILQGIQGRAGRKICGAQAHVPMAEL